MAENKEKSYNNRFLHQTLYWKWKDEMTEGTPAFLFLSYTFISPAHLLFCSLMSWFWPDVRSGTIWLRHLFLWNIRVQKRWRNHTLLEDLSINWASKFYCQFSTEHTARLSHIFTTHRYIKVRGANRKKTKTKDEKEVEVIECVTLYTFNTVSVITVTIKRRLWQSSLFFLLLLTSALYCIIPICGSWHTWMYVCLW